MSGWVARGFALRKPSRIRIRWLSLADERRGLLQSLRELISFSGTGTLRNACFYSVWSKHLVSSSISRTRLTHQLRWRDSSQSALFLSRRRSREHLHLWSGLVTLKCWSFRSVSSCYSSHAFAVVSWSSPGANGWVLRFLVSVIIRTGPAPLVACPASVVAIVAAFFVAQWSTSCTLNG